jgi:hypothetical protein
MPLYPTLCGAYKLATFVREVESCTIHLDG